MAVYAAMIDRMDRDIGRVVDELKQSGQLDNTLIIFLSDNGACAEWDPYGFDGESGPHNVLHTGKELKKIGSPESYVSYGSGWSNACNTPWRLYKHYGHEGGIAAPFIVHWPALLKPKGKLESRPSYLTDVMATLVDVTGATYPTEHNGTSILPCEGQSLAPAFRGQKIKSRPIFMEHEGNRAVRNGKWKLVGLRDHSWELYDMEKDRTEMHDLARSNPEQVRILADQWEAWADRANVFTPTKAKAKSEK